MDFYFKFGVNKKQPKLEMQDSVMLGPMKKHSTVNLRGRHLNPELLSI